MNSPIIYFKRLVLCCCLFASSCDLSAQGETNRDLSLQDLTGDSLSHEAESFGQDVPFGHTYTQNSSSISKIKRPLLALKTNLLCDITLMPNIEVEIPIRKHWSLNGELMFPWWLFCGDKYCLQILMGGLEGRYRPGNRQQHDVLIGHFFGLYAGGGKYDLQWDRNGYQGEFFIAAGISYGYTHKITRNLRLEYNIGIGVLRTDYSHYHARDNYRTLLWQKNGRYTWLGPTKAKISLVWLLNRKVIIQKGGER